MVDREDDRADQDEHNDVACRCDAVVAAGKELVDDRAEDLGRVAGAAFGHGPEQLVALQAADQRQRQDGLDGRDHQRERDVEEALDAVRAVKIRRLVIILGDGAEARQINDR